MSDAIVTLRKGAGRTLKQGGPWIYDNEIESIIGSFEDGDIVIVHDFDGYPLGRGFINRKSKLTVRMMTRNRDTEVNEDFIRMRVQNAWEYRKKVMDDISSCRVIFGEADFLPGIVVDKFADVLVVESLALGIDRFKVMIVDILKERWRKTGSISGASMSAAMRRSASRKEWNAVRDLSAGLLIRRWKSSKTACAIMWT